MSVYTHAAPLMASVALIAIASPAVAQSFTFGIAAQPMDTALRAFAHVTHRQILFDGAAVRGKRANAVHGSRDADDALGALLVGSGLEVTRGAGGAYVVRLSRGEVGDAAVSAVAPTASSVAAEPTPTDGGEIIVTANKRDERIIDVANSVTAIGEEALVTRNLTRIEEFAAQVPGLSIRTGINGGVTLVLRGENTGGAGATVAATVDDAPLSYTAANGGGASDTANIDTFDLQRLEVLRGPQGTLYGSAAEGGLVKYVINKPNFDKNEGRIELGGEGVDGGSVGGSARGVVNVAIVEGKLALRASGFYYKLPGYIQDPLGGRADINDGERYGGRIALAWKATDDLSIRLTALRQQQNFNGYGVVETLGSHASPATPPANFLDIANGGILERNTRISEFNRRKFNLYDGTINWALPFVDVTSITSYGEIETTYRLDNTNFALGGPNTIGSLFALRYGQPIIAASDIAFTLHKFNQEVRFSTKPNASIAGVPVDIQAGFFYTKEDILTRSFSNALSQASPTTVLTTPQPLGGTILPATYEEYSGFGQIDLHASDKLTLTAGTRYASNSQSSQSTTVGGFLTGASLVRAPIVSSEDKFTWNAAARYALSNRANVYARVASGYRPGGPIQPIPGAPADFPTQYKADSTVNYEVGFKGDLFNRRLSLDVAAFYIDWTDIQINSFFTSSISGLRYATTGNAGKAVSRGVEYSVGFALAKGFQVGAVGSYTDAHLTQDAPAFGGFNGDVLPYVPDFANTLNVDYSFPIAGDLKGFVGESWQYVSRRYSDFGTSAAFSNHVRVPGYHAVNAQAGIERGRYRVEIYCRNIFDSRGITRYQGGNGYNFSDTVDVIPPRTIGGRVTASF